MVSCLMGDSTALASAIVRCCHKSFVVDWLLILGAIVSICRKLFTQVTSPCLSIYFIFENGCCLKKGMIMNGQLN